MTARRFRLILMIAGMAIIVVVVGFLTRRGPKSLLASASRIADSEKWHRWWWASPNKLFVVERARNKSLSAYTLDTDSLHRTPLTGLTRTLALLGDAGFADSSPDCRWLVAFPRSPAEKSS